MKQDLTFLKPLVASVMLDDARAWTAQGFGFLRTYFGPVYAPKKYRLNLWDSRFTVKNVSTIHTHPWDFKSVIVAGVFANQRYTVGDPNDNKLRPTHHGTIIKTGEGGGLVKEPKLNIVLMRQAIELYGPGDVYGQTADEVHETIFKDGTVTLNERVGDTERAEVYWDFGTDWVDAVPRPATPAEARDAVLRSLREWF